MRMLSEYDCNHTAKGRAVHLDTVKPRVDGVGHLGHPAEPVVHVLPILETNAVLHLSRNECVTTPTCI